MNTGIYQIKNLIIEKSYVGSAANLYKRNYEHRRLLNNNKHPNRHLQFAWNKYGEENFKFEILEYCNKNELLEREQFWIDKINSCKNGYNLSPNASSQIGFKHSEETKKKISSAAKNISDETRAKMKAHIFSDEHKRKMKIARNKRITSEVTRLRMSEAQKKRNQLNLVGTPIILGDL
jgi:group I intron endonuclease